LHVEDVLSQGSGIATISADLSGAIDKLAAAFQGASDGVNYEGTHIDSAEVAGVLRTRRSRSDKITATQEDGRLDAQGTLDLGRVRSPQNFQRR
jgi:autotransporter translocation and assembly factor TamB